MIGHAQISNSFILLIALNEAKKALKAGDSEIIIQKSKGQLYKFTSTLRDALGYRLKREGLVKVENIANRSSASKLPPKYLVSKYIYFVSRTTQVSMKLPC